MNYFVLIGMPKDAGVFTHLIRFTKAEDARIGEDLLKKQVPSTCSLAVLCLDTEYNQIPTGVRILESAPTLEDIADCVLRLTHE